MAVDRIRTGSQAMYNSLSFYPGVPSVSRSPPFARPHRAATPKIAVSPAVTHTLVGPTLLVRFARPSILEQDASTLIVSSHDPLTTGTNLSDANDAGRNRTGSDGAVIPSLYLAASNRTAWARTRSFPLVGLRFPIPPRCKKLNQSSQLII